MINDTTCDLCDGERLDCHNFPLEHLAAYRTTLCPECINAICEYGEVSPSTDEVLSRDRGDE